VTTHLRHLRTGGNLLPRQQGDDDGAQAMVRQAIASGNADSPRLRPRAARRRSQEPRGCHRDEGGLTAGHRLPDNIEAEIALADLLSQLGP
jgi:hypothetical protein